MKKQKLFWIHKLNQYSLLVGVIIVLLPLHVFSQEAKTFSLAEAKEFAKKNAYTVKNAENDILAAKLRIKETTALGLPQINGGASYQNFIALPVSLVPAQFFGGKPGEFAELQFGTEQNMRAEITGTQLIFDGSYFVGLQAARVYSELNKTALIKSQAEVSSNVSRAYYVAQVAQENLKLLEKSKATLDKILFETRELVLNGFAEEQNIDQLELLVANIKTSIDAANNQKENALSLLKFQMGLDIATPIMLKDSLNVLFAFPDGEKALSVNADVSSLSDYKLVANRERLMFLNYRLEQSKFLPRLNGMINYQRNAFSNDFSFLESSQKWFPTNVWGVNLQVPIFSSYMRISRVKQAKIEHEKAINSLQMAEQSLKMQLQNARSAYLLAIERNKNEKSNLELAEKIRNKTMVRYKEGMASSMELSQTENQYLTTQGNYINSIFQVLNAKLEFDNALGNY
jgi:outer membrane protein